VLRTYAKNTTLTSIRESLFIKKAEAPVLPNKLKQRCFLSWFPSWFPFSVLLKQSSKKKSKKFPAATKKKKKSTKESKFIVIDSDKEDIEVFGNLEENFNLEEEETFHFLNIGPSFDY
jgi:hypothetical protein